MKRRVQHGQELLAKRRAKEVIGRHHWEGAMAQDVICSQDVLG